MAMALMGLGGIIISFGMVVFIIEMFARYFGSEHGLRVMTVTGMGLLVIGAIMFGFGFLVSRFRRNDTQSAL